MLVVIGLALFVALPLAVLAWLCAAWVTEHRSDRIPILLYHRLIREAGADAGGVRDDEPVWVSYDTHFEAQMDLLRREGFTTLDFDDYVRIRSGEQERPARPVIVTFDDGYSSNHEIAFPVLRRNGQRATVFVACEPDAHTRELVEGIDGFLSPAQMKEMSDAGVSIQSHSLTHAILTDHPDDVVRFELAESRRRLEAITGKPVRHFAVPRAGYDRRVRGLVREQGYATACCNNKGTSTGWSDPLALPRIVVERDMSAEDLVTAMTPRAGFVLRVVGNVKRIPERIGGVHFAQRVRGVLYRGPMLRLFTTRNLRRLVAVAGACYVGGGLLFAWHVLR